MSHKTTAETTWVRQSHIMKLPGSWSWPLHHLRKWKIEEKSLALKWGTRIFVLMSPRCGLSFIMGKAWQDSSISYQILVLPLFKGVTLQKFQQMYWLSFSLIHPFEHTEAGTAYSNVTAYYYSTMVAHGLSMTHAKWPKYWLAFRAPWILLLLNTEHSNICHKNSAESPAQLPLKRK